MVVVVVGHSGEQQPESTAVEFTASSTFRS